MADNTVNYEESLRRENINDEELEDDDCDDEPQGWDDWGEEAGDGDEEDPGSVTVCLFCDSTFGEAKALFDHCVSNHHFDFHGVRRALSLDFYASFRLINYIRSQVAENRCWSCGLLCDSKQDLQNHLHKTTNPEDVKPLWNNEAYLKPVLEDDPLLYSFCEDEDVDVDEDTMDIDIDKEDLMTCGKKFDEIRIDKEISEENLAELEGDTSDRRLRAYFPNRAAKDVKIINEDYFGSYSSFGIHREMLSDKVRTDAYRQALVQNPSLLNGAVVLDVGCGTGILSLFAAQAGASRVIAVEASEKMAAVATRIARNNGHLRSSESNEVVEVVQTMVEELDKKAHVEPHSIDVLVSEWMGYCLLYESMLGSVLYARDRWLKPGGAILPDTATMIVAGFGKGGTSLPFWENVYGFDMSCVGSELVQDAARIPIVDTVEPHDLVTNASVLKTFDLVTMKPDEVDFTASVELSPISSDSELGTTRCYGAVLWFETGFTNRFCKEMPANLSTSPFNTKTHWSQTILTFREPIFMASGKSNVDQTLAIGTDSCPAAKISLRISIVRASQHRSIDISMETSGIGPDGRKRSWPVQFFNLE